MAASLVGRNLGMYQITELLGQGGSFNVDCPQDQLVGGADSFELGPNGWARFKYEGGWLEVPLQGGGRLARQTWSLLL